MGTKQLIPWVYFVLSNILTGTAFILFWKQVAVWPWVLVAAAAISFILFLVQAFRLLKEQQEQEDKEKP